MSMINGKACVINGTPVDKVFSDGKQVYGRNLALGTTTAFKLTSNAENSYYQAQPIYAFSNTIPHETLITISFDISSSTGAGNFEMQFDGNDNDIKSSWQDISVGNLVNGTKHVSVTLTTDSNHLHAWERLNNATGTVAVSNLIISESSTEVAWSPAPEDVM